MVKYIKQEMNDLRSEGAQRSYYKVPTYSKITGDGFLQFMSQNKGMTHKGAAEAVLIQVMESLSYWLSVGHTVTVPHLGTFRLAIGAKEGRTVTPVDSDEPQLNAQSIGVRGVRFRPSSEFLKQLREDVKLEGEGCVQHIHHPTTTLDERLAMLRQALTERPFMTVVDYVELTGLRRSSATKELAALAADPDSGITTRGRGSHKVYVAQNLSE